jgi:subtilisin family serine protease
MLKDKFPFRYFLYLTLLLIISILFWLMVFGFNNSSNHQTISNSVFGGNHEIKDEYWSSYFQDNISQFIPIDTNKIIVDTLNRRRIVSNVVNIAIKNTTNSIVRFASELKELYPSSQYKIIYIDTVINRMQLELPENDRIAFKTEVKQKLDRYKLLVWDEILFDYVKNFNDPKVTDDNLNWYLKAINIDKAWDQTIGDKSVVIAVVDNGFDLNHPELINKAVSPYNVIDKSKDVSPGSENHGTHVASTIVANGNNNQGLVGICPGCSFMPIKVEDQNGNVSNTYVIDAILYAIKNKADVINLSLGMQFPFDEVIPLQEQKSYINSNAKDEEEFWQDLFEYANKNNVICVLAAGNSNVLTGFDPFQRSSNTIKVGAIDQKFNKASFSNYGSLTTIYAPGTRIFGAKPGNTYEILQGTSMAAPIVSGFIGLLKSQNKNISTREVVELLDRNTVTKNDIKILNAISTTN